MDGLQVENKTDLTTKHTQQMHITFTGFKDAKSHFIR